MKLKSREFLTKRFAKTFPDRSSLSYLFRRIQPSGILQACWNKRNTYTSTVDPTTLGPPLLFSQIQIPDFDAKIYARLFYIRASYFSGRHSRIIDLEGESSPAPVIDNSARCTRSFRFIPSGLSRVETRRSRCSTIIRSYLSLSLSGREV